eukprot:gene469-594_t
MKQKRQPKDRNNQDIDSHTDQQQPNKRFKDSQGGKKDLNTTVSTTTKINNTSSNTKKKKLSKEELLKQAEEKERIINEAKRTGVGRNVAEALKWSAAMDKAKGIKLKDNPSLIRKSMKRDKKRKQKSSREWHNRKNEENDKLQARIQKREANIQAKIDKKKAIKNGTHKKTTPKKGGGGQKRAGFEGKKKSFINKK